MTHAYPLHADIQAQCLCCLAQHPFRFTSTTDQVVCSACVHHIGSEKSGRRDQEHVRMWLARFEAAEEAHRVFIEEADALLLERDTALTEVRSQVDQLTGIVAGQFDAAIDGVRGMLQNTLVKRAERNTELARRQIDWSLVVIWRLAQLHHDSSVMPGQCACGRKLGSCAESTIIDPVRQAVHDWEKKNVQLLGEGKRHALPSDHPAVLAG